jgi:phosphate acetyltransferase
LQSEKSYYSFSPIVAKSKVWRLTSDTPLESLGVPERDCMNEVYQTSDAFISHLRARAFSHSKRIVLTDGEDLRVLAAANFLVKNSLVQPIIVGRTSVLLPLLRRYGMSDTSEIYDPFEDPRRFELESLLFSQWEQRGKAISDPPKLHKMAYDPVYCGTLLVKAGYADGMVGGATVPTAHVIRAGLQVIGPDPHHPVVSGAFVMVLAEPLAADRRVLVFADTAVVPQPSGEQLANITINTAHLTRAILGQEPIVALLSFSTYGSADNAAVIPVREALKIVRQMVPELCVDGEMQIDAALIPTISESKAPGNLIKGRANVLIFPNLDAGNAAYKLVERVGRAIALGVILSGLALPLNDLSRGCSSEDIVNMVAVTVLQSVHSDIEQLSILQNKVS